MTDKQLVEHYSETVAQLRANGWSDEKIIATLRRKWERDQPRSERQAHKYDREAMSEIE